MNPPTDESYQNFLVDDQATMKKIIAKKIDTQEIYVRGQKIEPNLVQKALEDYYDFMWEQKQQSQFIRDDPFIDCIYTFDTDSGQTTTLNKELEILGDGTLITTVATDPNTIQTRNRGFLSSFTVGSSITNSNYTSIQAAINAAIAVGGNPIIYIRNATFTENVIINTTVPLVIYAESAILNGSIDITNSNSVVTLIGIKFTGNQTFGLRINGSRVSCLRCSFECTTSTSSIALLNANIFSVSNSTFSNDNKGVSGSALTHLQVSGCEFTNPGLAIEIIGGTAGNIISNTLCTNVTVSEIYINICESTITGTLTYTGAVTPVPIIPGFIIRYILLSSSVVNNAIFTNGEVIIAGSRITGGVNYTGQNIIMRVMGSSFASLNINCTGTSLLQMLGSDIYSTSTSCNLLGLTVNLISVKINCTTFTTSATTVIKIINTSIAFSGGGTSSFANSINDCNNLELSSPSGHTVNFTSTTRTILTCSTMRNITLFVNTTGDFIMADSKFTNTVANNCVTFGSSANSNYRFFNIIFVCPVTAISVTNPTTGIQVANCDFTGTGTGPTIAFVGTTVVSLVFNCVFNNSAGGVVCISNSGGTATHVIGGNQAITGTPTSGSFTIRPFNLF